MGQGMCQGHPCPTPGESFLAGLSVFPNKTLKEKYCFGDVSGGPVVENPRCNAGDSGSIPGQGTKIPSAKEQLSPHATARRSTCCNKSFQMLQLRPNAHCNQMNK